MNTLIRNLSIVAATVCLISNVNANGRYANYKGETLHNYKGEGVIVEPAPCPPENCLHDGFYIGIGGAYDAYKVRQGVNVLDPVVGNLTANPQLSAKGWNGGLFGGYGQYFDWFYIAGELLVNFSDAQSSYGITWATVDQYNANFKARTTYGASILPGVRLDNASLLYVRLGYVRTFFKTNENGTTSGGNFSVTQSNWENGYNYGVGIEAAFYENFSVRGEYTYSSYNSFTSSMGTKFSPSNNQFVLALNYHFC